MDKIHIMDRLVLYIGIAEILFMHTEIPIKVSINEAIEMSKSFGNNLSHKFINGVLDIVAKESGVKIEEATK